MKGGRHTLRNHLLAATMADRWETLKEISAALRSKYGLVMLQFEVLTWLGELGKDGIHILAHRERQGSSLKEYRLYVKVEKVGRENRGDLHT